MELEVHVLDADTGSVLAIYTKEGVILGDLTTASKAIYLLTRSLARSPFLPSKPLDCQGPSLPAGKGKTDGT